MNPVPDDFPFPVDPRVEAAAADWLVKRDRGLTAAQQDEFLQWLTSSPAHRESFERHRRLWKQFDALVRWRPEHSAVPNPDLLARRRRPSRLRWLVPAILAAAAVVLGFWLPPSSRPRGGETVVFEAPGYRQEVLADGTIVDLNRGAHLFVQFGAVERRVLLVQGEAQFTVAKDAARPFVVRAGGVDLRAVGTTFNVKLAGASIEVLVTEGTVQVAQREMAASPVAGESGAPSASPALLAELRAGQRTVIAVAPVFVPPVVERASPQEIARLLEWTPYLLDFDSTPLVEVVATFNRTSATRLVIADEALRELPIVASIRFDNVEGFVRLLEATMGVRAERRASGEIALHRAR